MEDNELIASFEPRLKGWVLVLAFDDVEDMLLEQEKVQALFRRDRDDHGNELPQVETLWMGQTQFGERRLMAGQVAVGALVSSVAGLEEVQQARRAWAQKRLLTSSRLPAKQGTSEGWHPSTDQMDMFDKWAEEVLEPNPAGSESWAPRIKASVARDGFNWYCQDHDRPDLQLHGVPGGKAFSGMLRAMFPEALAVRRQEQNVYYHGLKRREGVNPKYFKRS